MRYVPWSVAYRVGESPWSVSLPRNRISMIFLFVVRLLDVAHLFDRLPFAG
jgi:hypothetical protein